MNLIDILIQIVFFLMGTVSGYYINYVFNKRNLEENQSLFEKRFGPQLIKILVGETDFKYKRLSEAYSESKEAIGNYVAQRWGIEGSTILLDAGTTTERVARSLASLDVKNLIVCTANPIAALHFMSRERQNCFLLPGEIDENYAGAMSSKDLISETVIFAEKKSGKRKNKLQSERYRIGIIGALPIFPVTGPCSNDERTLHIKQTIINLCQEIVIVVDITKFFEDDKYKGKYHPVFKNKKEWEALLKGKHPLGKKITIVTYQQNKNDEEQSSKIRKLNIQYYSSIHCIFPNTKVN
jgi:DeoR/GlpR family transcriptional regulator of sugar metabolism